MTATANLDRSYDFSFYAKGRYASMFFQNLKDWTTRPNILSNPKEMQRHCLRAMPGLLPWSLPFSHFSEVEQARFQQLLTESLQSELTLGLLDNLAISSRAVLNADFMSHKTHRVTKTPQQALVYAALCALVPTEVPPSVRVTTFFNFVTAAGTLKPYLSFGVEGSESGITGSGNACHQAFKAFLDTAP